MTTKFIPPDVTVECHGSIALLQLHSETARSWVRDNVGDEVQYFGSRGLVVEPRYVANLVHGMIESGLEVS